MILNFNQHYQELTREVRAMSQILRKTKLGSHRKLRIIDSLLLAKFHTIHLGVFNPAQIKHINTIINSATRQSLGYTPSLPVQAIHNVQEQYGLGRSHVQARAASLGTKHMIQLINKPTQRGVWQQQHIQALLGKIQPLASRRNGNQQHPPPYAKSTKIHAGRLNTNE